MTPSGYTGPERRGDDISTRLALLEQSVSLSDFRHKETKKSLAAVHKRLSEIKSEVALEIKQGLEAILAKMDSESTKRAESCAEHQQRTAKIENTVGWIDRWVLAAWASIVTIGGWIFAHGPTKHGG